MAAGSQQSKFKVVEVRGWSERDIFESDDLEELVEFLSQKTGTEGDT